MAWQRKRLKNGKIWVECQDDGTVVVNERGLARYRYRKDDTRDYSTRADLIRELDGSVPTTTGQPVIPPHPSSSAPARRRRPPKDPMPPVVGLVNDDSPIEKLGQASHDFVEVHTDGACTGNPGPAGAGVVLRWGPYHREIRQYLGHGTNNIAELTAIELGLQAITKPALPIRLYTDSSYCIGVLTGRYKAKANRELIKRIRFTMDQFPDLQLLKVRGHAGVPQNERADELARLAIEEAHFEPV